ncbi:MAG: hypothetical protein KBH07_14085, partial [Flavobacteriales bacterium]|nr:hypothetical protein [Flavobacteriales bacterium]
MQGAIRRWGVLLLVVGWASGASAGRLEKAFAALERYDYFKAKALFQRSVKRHPAAAWYGLSVITGRADNPFYQLDSSHAAIRRAMAAYPLMDDRDLARTAMLGVDSAAIHAQWEHVAGLAWQQVNTLGRAEDYQRFVQDFAGSSQVQLAVERRNELAFAAAREANTSTAYQAFLQQFPDAEQALGARSRLQEAIFREAVPTGTLAEYEAFIRDHPENTHVRDAQDMLMELNTPHKTAMEFAAFIRRYPDNPN